MAKTIQVTRPTTETETEPDAAADVQAPSVVGVFDLSALVLASLSSTAAPELPQVEIETAPAAPSAAAAPQAKPAADGPKPEIVAYVHVPDCIACHACATECPTGAIEVVDHSVIDPDICNACNACVPVCPTNCISLQPRSGYMQLEYAVQK